MHVYMIILSFILFQLKWNFTKSLISKQSYLQSKLFHSHIYSLKHQYHKLYALDTSSNVIMDTLVCINHIEFDASKYLLSGAIAGGCRGLSRGITFPLDTIKTFQQSYNNTNNQAYKEINYFRGIYISTLSAIPANAVFFLIYNFLEQYYPCIQHSFMNNDIIQSISFTTLLRRILFSSIATIPQNFIKTPAELIKQRSQLSPKNVSIITVIYDAINDNNIGIRGLFIGANAQLIRELPYNAFQMALYDMFKEYSILQGYISLTNSNSVNILSIYGAIAAFIAALLTQPADVLKTKLMTRKLPNYNNNNNNNSITNNRIRLNHKNDTATTTALKDNIDNVDSNNTILATNISTNTKITLSEAIKDIWDNEGIFGFYRGLLPRLLIVTFGGLVYFYAAEIILKH